VERAYAQAKDILTKNKAKLIQMAERLIAEETLEGEKLEALFKEPVPSATSDAGSADGEPDAAKGDSTGKAAVN
jgi:cell division protease FtsH